MTYATLMVLLQLGQANANLLQVVCRESPVPAQLFEEDRKEFDRALRAAEVGFRTALQSRASRLEWRPRVTVLPLSDYLAGEARGADLVVTGTDRNAPPFDPTRQVDTSDLVIQAGRPILVVPAAVVKASFDRVVVGWKDTAESRRAIVDALPLLAKATHVTIAEITAREELADARTRLADVVGWLGHRGIEAQPVVAAGQGTRAQELAAIADEHRVAHGQRLSRERSGRAGPLCRPRRFGPGRARTDGDALESA